MTLDRQGAPAMSFKESQSRSQDTDMWPIQARPGRKQACPAKAALAIGSVTLPVMLGTMRHYRMRGWLIGQKPSTSQRSWRASKLHPYYPLQFQADERH